MLKELKNDGLYKIELETHDNTFIVKEKVEDTEDYDELKKFKNFHDAEKYIENREKRKEAGITKKKEPLLVIYKDNWKYKDVKLTSLSPSRWGGSFDVWISFPDKKRSKHSFYSKTFFKVNDDNKKKITEMQELRKKAEELEESLDSYSEDEIKNYFKDEDE